MKARHSLWTEEELRIAVEAYLYILYLQQHGVPFSRTQIERFLIAGPLRGRNEASIRYRMRNISWVLQELSWPTVRGYSPAQGVGKNIADKIRLILKDLPSTLPFRKKYLSLGIGQNSTERPTHDELIQNLERLETALKGINIPRGGIGHNNPPEPLDDGNNIQHQLTLLREEVDKLKKEAKKKSPDKKILKKGFGVLFQSGLKFVLWIAGTVSTIVLTTAITPKVPEILMAITDVLRSISKFIG